MATITIKGEVQSRSGVSAKGKDYTIHSQPASLETDNIRTPFDLELDKLADAKPVGSKWNWNPESDLRVGRYGPELARFMTLTPAKA